MENRPVRVSEEGPAVLSLLSARKGVTSIKTERKGYGKIVAWGQRLQY